MKDKIKPIKSIDDNTTIPKVNTPQPVKYNWFTCIVCGQDMHKKGKERIVNGINYTSFESKKYFKLWDKMICWNCTFNLVKQFKNI